MICEAVLKLVPLPKVSISLLVPFADMKSAIEMVPNIVRSKVIPTAIEYMSRDTILFSESYLGKRFPDTKNDAYILLTFDGNTDAHNLSTGLVNYIKQRVAGVTPREKIINNKNLVAGVKIFF